jgi:hypothetical protein
MEKRATETLAVRTAASAAARERVALPSDIAQDSTPYGFIGRDSAVLALERAMRRPPLASTRS